jgi:hypothetical protein
MSTSLNVLSEPNVAMQTEIDSENFYHYSHHSTNENVCRANDEFLYLVQVIWTCPAVEFQDGGGRFPDDPVHVHEVISFWKHHAREHHAPRTGLGF